MFAVIVLLTTLVLEQEFSISCEPIIDVEVKLPDAVLNWTLKYLSSWKLPEVTKGTVIEPPLQTYLAPLDTP